MKCFLVVFSCPTDDVYAASTFRKRVAWVFDEERICSAGSEEQLRMNGEHFDFEAFQDHRT